MIIWILLQHTQKKTTILLSFVKNTSVTQLYCLCVSISSTNQSFSIDMEASGESRVSLVVFLTCGLASAGV